MNFKAILKIKNRYVTIDRNRYEDLLLRLIQFITFTEVESFSITDISSGFSTIDEKFDYMISFDISNRILESIDETFEKHIITIINIDSKLIFQLPIYTTGVLTKELKKEIMWSTVDGYFHIFIDLLSKLGLGKSHLSIISMSLFDYCFALRAILQTKDVDLFIANWYTTYKLNEDIVLLGVLFTYEQQENKISYLDVNRVVYVTEKDFEQFCQFLHKIDKQFLTSINYRETINKIEKIIQKVDIIEKRFT